MKKYAKRREGGGKNMRRQFYSQLEPLTLQYFCTYLMVVELFTTTFVTVRFLKDVSYVPCVYHRPRLHHHVPLVQ